MDEYLFLPGNFMSIPPDTTCRRRCLNIYPLFMIFMKLLVKTKIYLIRIMFYIYNWAKILNTYINNHSHKLENYDIRCSRNVLPSNLGIFGVK